MWSCNQHLSSTVAQGYHTLGPLMFNAVQTLFAAQCLIAPDVFEELKESQLEKLSNTTYDFVVIGAGTAGGVIVNRLLETKQWTVLVLEAGGNPTLATEIPTLFINNYGTNEDWNFRTEPQEHACLNYKERRCYWPRGKVLGGTSSINGLYYIKGNRKDYDNWGLENWSYEKIEKYFLKLKPFKENNTNVRAFINLEHNNENHPLENVLLKANEELGIDILDNLNGEKQMGVGSACSTTKDGQRHSTFNAFLKSLNDKRLTVVKNVYVDEIVIEKDENGKHIAVSVKYFSPKEASKIYEVKAAKEIVLSAGTINSAYILFKSGIGPEEMLKGDANMTLKLNLPVGQNLQDHIFAPVMFKMESNDDSNNLPNIFKGFYEYVTERKGPLSDLRPQRVVSFINTKDPKSDSPDVQNHFIVVYPNQSNIVDIFGQHRFSDQFYNAFNELNKNHLIIIVYVTCLQPKSKGEIVYENNNVMIKANYLKAKEDLDTIVRGMKRVIQLKDTTFFKNAGLKIHWIEIDACKHINETTDDFLECIARHLTGTLYHAVGTNKMGKVTDQTTVVDENLIVKSVKNLRVVDASVMPNIVRGNTMAATLMIAEKAADLIKEGWL